MSLRSFHIVFIVVSILFSALLGSWSFVRYGESGAAQMLGLFLFCIAAFIGLTTYLIRFRKKTKILMLVTAFIAASQMLATNTLACAVCFNPENESVRTSVNSAILFLIGLTTLVVGALAYFVLRILKSDIKKNQLPQ